MFKTIPGKRKQPRREQRWIPKHQSQTDARVCTKRAHLDKSDPSAVGTISGFASGFSPPFLPVPRLSAVVPQAVRTRTTLRPSLKIHDGTDNNLFPHKICIDALRRPFLPAGIGAEIRCGPWVRGGTVLELSRGCKNSRNNESHLLTKPHLP